MNTRSYSSLGIVIVNWKSKHTIMQCLKSLEKSKFPESNIIIVDNFSNDGSCNVIRKKWKKIVVLKQDQNYGFGKANNIGIKYHIKHGKTQIMLINPDTIVNINTFHDLIYNKLNFIKTGIFGPIILANARKIWTTGGIVNKIRYSGGLMDLGKEIDILIRTNPYEVDYIPGAAMLITSDVIAKIGLLNENYFIYYEDTEFCERAKRYGIKSIIIPKSKIIHKESSSMRKGSSSHQYFMARNHLLFVERNAPLYVKIREMIRIPKTIYEHYRKGEKYAILGIRDYFLRRFGKRDYWS